MIRRLNTLLALPLALLFWGCQDREIKTYRVAKEEKQPLPLASGAEDSHEGHNHGDAEAQAPAPQVHWELPPGWKEQKADRMRAASFQVVADDGRMAEVVVIPLPPANDIESQAVNFWRQEVGLEPANITDLEQQRQKVEVGPGSGNLYEFVSAAPKGGQKFNSRLVGVVSPQNDTLWFVKMRGDDTLVTEEKPKFLNFLKSLHFTAAPAQLAQADRPVSTNTKKVPASADLPKWKVPANWQEKAPGPMILAAYGVAGAGGQADVTISKLSGDAGGQGANINRWRGQLGLPPATEADLTQTVTTIDIDGKKAYVVDIKGTNVRTGKPARMVAMGCRERMRHGSTSCWAMKRRSKKKRALSFSSLRAHIE